MNATDSAERLLLDATVWCAAKIPHPVQADACRALVVDPSYSVASLDLTLHEVANAVGARGGWADDAVDMCRLISGRCGHAVVAADPMLIRAALDIAREHDITAYDAAYVAVARREAWTLVSLDIKDLVAKGLAITPDAAV